MIPIVAPKRLWPNSSSVSLTALNRKANRIFLWARISRLNSCGKVNTRWKYPTGKSSEVCFSNHLALASDWHLGQWRLRRGVLIGGLKTPEVGLFWFDPRSLGGQGSKGPLSLSCGGWKEMWLPLSSPVLGETKCELWQR